MLTAQLRPYQDEAVDTGLERGSLLIAYEMGLGKEQPVSEPVLTPDRGWVPIGDIRIGDQVIGKDGRPTKVLGVYPQGEKDVYEFVFSDRSRARAGEEHLWEVRTNNDVHRGTKRVMTTRELLDSGLRDGANNRKYRIPMVSPVEGEHRDLPLDPYLLGLLLGDGGIKGVGVKGRNSSVIFTTADAELLDEVRSRLPEGMTVNRITRYDYRLVTPRGQRNPLIDALKGLGLAGHGSESKFIPEIYLHASCKQRLELLQGLMDTDGHVRPKDGNAEFYTVSPQLARDVASLVQSLGGTAAIRTKRTTHRLCYRMSVRLPEELNPFRMARKSRNHQPFRKYAPTRLIESIELIGREESVCIYVAADDHLYVTRDYVVTHNTIVTLAICEELIGREEGDFMCAIVVPANLKWQWMQQIAQHTDVTTTKRRMKMPEGVVEVDVPTSEWAVCIDGDAAKRERILHEVRRNRPNYVILGYENVVNDWDVVRRLKPDLICLDEATAIKTFSAQRTKKIKRWTADYRFALTGTPIENGKPEELYSIMQWVDDSILGRWDLFERTYITRDKFGKVINYKNLPIFHARVSQAMVRKRRTDPEVAPYLPDVKETTVWVDIDEQTQKVSHVIGRALQDALKAAAEKGMAGVELESYYKGEAGKNGSKEQGLIMSRMQAMEMLLAHPDLVVKSAEDWLSDDPKVKTGNRYCAEVVSAGYLHGLTSAPKMDALIRLVRESLHHDRDAKIIIFSQWRRVGEIIAERLDELGIRSTPYHGGMNAAQKAGSVARYRDDPDVKVIICSHAGAFGTDLYMANVLINYDLPWSAGTADQINARHVRVASTFEQVKVINLVCRDTIEARKPDVLAFKRKTASAVVDGKGADWAGRLVNDVASLTEYLDATLPIDAEDEVDK